MSEGQARDKSPQSSQSIPQTKAHIKGLDGLRGIAFLSVFVFHLGKSGHSNLVWLRLAQEITSGGWMGVDLFFVLSGFLITGILLNTRGDAHFFRNFYTRRSLRIFPLYYGIAIVLLLLTPILHLQWNLGHIAFLFYLNNIVGAADPSLWFVKPAVWIVHTWSLAVEEQFYLIWPLLIFSFRSSRKLVGLCLLGIGTSLCLRLICLHLFHAGEEIAYMELPTHWDGLLCGAVAAILLRRIPLATLVDYSRTPVLIAAIGLAVIVWHNGDLNYHNIWFTVAGYPLLAVFFTGILLRVMQPGTLLARIGGLGILRFFGRYSYGMYLYHILFAPLVGKLLPVLQRGTHSVALGGLLYFFLCLAATSLVSVASYVFYEQWWLRMKSRFQAGPAVASESNLLDSRVT